MTNLLRRARFKRDHRWAPNHMSSYLDGQLGSRSHTRMERHTGECPDCRGIVRSLQRMLGRLHGLPPASPTPEAADIAAAVRARLHEHDGS